MRPIERSLLGLAVIVCAILTAFLPHNQAFTPMTWCLGIPYALALFALGWLLLMKHPGRPTGSTWSSRHFWAIGIVFGMLLVAPAILLNTVNLSSLEKLDLLWLGAAGYAPIVEESLKGVAVLLLVMGLVRISKPIEAVCLGIAVGIGFTITEDAVSIARAILDDLNSDLTAGIAEVFIRLLYGGLHHSLWTGLCAWGIGQFICRTDRAWSWRFMRLCGWWLVAVSLHTLSNSFAVLNSVFPNADWPAFISLFGFLAYWVANIVLYLRSRKVSVIVMHHEPIT